jgi:hypothetical protein
MKQQHGVGMVLHIDRNIALAGTAAAVRLVDPNAPERAPDERAAFAAQFIPVGARVLELGCGRMALKRFLPNGCSYQGCDLVARDDNTVVCDLNAGEFPSQTAAQSDIIVMLGLLETIVDVESFFTHLRFSKRDVVLSYCATNLTGKCDRAALGWVNSFSFFDLARLFDRYGFRIECTAPIDSAQALMRLTPAERLMSVTPCTMAVVSGDTSDQFGGRLRMHMINALLPGEADVHHLSFRTLAQAREAYDLVVVGTGDSLFQPFIGDEVLDIVDRGKAAIGIFGTQRVPGGGVPGAAAGHFRSMLIDIFGRSYPEKEFFLVDRDAVTCYKARIHRNAMRVGERIEAILRNAALAAS